MSKIVEVRVPDIGNFKDVSVIELCVQPGDAVKEEDPLLTMESDKASIDLPSPVEGVVRELKAGVGDRISKGTLIALIESASAAKAGHGAENATPSVSPPRSPSPAVDAASGRDVKADMECGLLVLGAGPGGYSAAFRAADLGLDTILVERYSTLGGVCLNVGCIPSKALLHATGVWEEALRLTECGIRFEPPQVDIDRLRAYKNSVVAQLTGGLAGMAKARKVRVVCGEGRFLDAHHLEINSASTVPEGETKKIIRFDQCIIAVGSSPVHLPFLPNDPRIMDSTGALALSSLPKTMLVIGGGIIGLEMAAIYSTLGTRIEVVEMLESLMPGPDRDAVKVWEKRNAGRFGKVMLKTRTVGVEARGDGLYARFEGADAPGEPVRYDMILQSAGRVSNGGKLSAEKAGVAVDERGMIPVNNEQRTSAPHIFAIGDVTGNPMLAHKAVHEGHVAAEVAAGQSSAFDAKIIPGVAFTHPEIAWAGLTEDQAKKENRKVLVAKFPLVASGRALANQAAEGFSKLVFDADTHRLVGGVLVGPGAGDMIGEVALAIEMGCDAVDIGKTIHPHPTFCESIGLAAEMTHGACTDLPPQRKR